ncbi:hypothetical protein [Defluviimonas sp. WL0075]|uniref:Uncharacterized protein n=1 Tax=Albidovulum sediminicola TaxID=2984331 RepID=A0ABT2Z379_9RHOB|nr:hypothetical protein [Defluviimonas sp. WL0075]MCV2865465.1 hypothetical protein [Defluviimonas sp. WL0075]
MPRPLSHVDLTFLLLTVAFFTTAGCERMVDDYHKDRGIMKVVRDRELRLVEEAF